MSQTRKVLVKVMKDGEWKWVHLCYIYTELCDTFFKVTGCEKSAFGTFLSMWARGDFGIKTSMATYEDVQELRYLVTKKYSEDYAELYALNKEENPRIDGWFRMWISQHMRIEIAARKED